MQRSDIAFILEQYGVVLNRLQTVEGQIVATSGQAYNGPVCWASADVDTNMLRVRVVSLPPGIDPHDPRAREHAKLVDVYIDIADVSSFMVEPKVATVVAPDGSKVVLS